jgi:hypothetical protein
VVNNAILSAVTWVAALRDAVAGRISEESGQGILEYAVLVGAIIFAAAAILWAAGGFDFETFRDAIQGCLNFDDTVCN